MGDVNFMKKTILYLLLLCTVVSCFACNSEYVHECVHEYDSEVTTEASCNSEGVRTYTCVKCEYAYTENIEKTEHVFGEDDWEVLSEPTWRYEGEKSKKCSVCSEEVIEKTPAVEMGEILDNLDRMGVLYSEIALLSDDFVRYHRERDYISLRNNWLEVFELGIEIVVACGERTELSEVKSAMQKVNVFHELLLPVYEMIEKGYQAEVGFHIMAEAVSNTVNTYMEAYKAFLEVKNVDVCAGYDWRFLKD